MLLAPRLGTSNNNSNKQRQQKQQPSSTQQHQAHQLTPRHRAQNAASRWGPQLPRNASAPPRWPRPWTLAATSPTTSGWWMSGWTTSSGNYSIGSTAPQWVPSVSSKGALRRGSASTTLAMQSRWEWVPVPPLRWTHSGIDRRMIFAHDEREGRSVYETTDNPDGEPKNVFMMN